MPFQSEKQRRYLWANEPKIARDWADTYGSRIKKNDGGITQAGVTNYLPSKMVDVPVEAKSSPEHVKAHLAYITDKEQDLLLKKNLHGSLKGKPNRGPGGIPSLQGDFGPGGNNPGGFEGGGGNRSDNDVSGRTDRGTGEYRVTDRKAQQEYDRNRKARADDIKAKEKAKLIEKKKAKAKEKLRTKLEKRSYKNLILRKIKGSPLTPPALAMLDALKGPISDEEFEKAYGVSYEDFKTMNPMQMEAILGSVKGKVSQAERDDIRRLSGGIEEGGDFSTIFFGPKGPPVIPQDGEGLPRYQRYPNYEELLGAQNQGVGGIEVGPEYDFNRDFQASLTGTADTPDYYAGDNPLASNLAWGKQMNVDPRTMGRTSYAADGGRISAAFGGIMDRSTGRRAYGLGSIFKSIKKAAGKVLKSPIGKAALIGGSIYGANQMGWLGKDSFLAPLFRKNIAAKDAAAKYGGLSLAKLGILGATAAPFFMGGPEEDEDDKGVDYDLLKNKYTQQLMNIKRGVNAGSLDPNEFSYLPSDYIYTGAEGGRAGYYAGGQSIPSPYTIEDARKSSMQDKMGGITDVMKRADLARQGDVGQMYMAQGGRIGADEGGLMDMGGMEKDYRNDGGFVPIGGEEKADDVPARLSRNEFVFTADAVRGAGGGDIDKGAEIMENMMTNLEQGGQISEETQGLGGAQEMFDVSERIGEVI